ncbi:tRNA 2'-phosphotransferase [Coemansia sp. Benny D115]|nr:tRNA 2'-phosphotransferase [Coemansia sp. Benny D115]
MSATPRRPPRKHARRDISDAPEVRLSKLLSYLLRHGAAAEGLTLRPDGSILVSELQKHNKLTTTTFEQIKHVVDTNDKKRYALFQERDVGGNMAWYIRATQGHSVELKKPPLVLLTQETMPRCIVHGTIKGNVAAIRKTGLSRMNRTHIHFASGLYGEEGIVSGMRATSDAYIYIDIAKATKDGIQFYTSENNVILSKGLGDSGVIPPAYFEKIVFKE